MFSSVKSRSVSPFNIRNFEYIGTANRDGASTPSFTFNNISLGTPYPRTTLIISAAIFETTSSNNVDVVTVTIDGQNASIIVPENITSPAESNSHNSIHSLNVSNKTLISSLTLVPEDSSLTFAYALWKINTIKQQNTPLNFENISRLNGESHTISTARNGVAISTHYTINSFAGISASGAVQDFNYDTRSGENFVGVSVYPTDGGSLTFTYSNNAGASLAASSVSFI